MVKNLTAMTFRVNGVVGATATITSASTFSAADFMFGGGGLFTAENGVPPPVYVLARLTRAGSAPARTRDRRQPIAICLGSTSFPLGSVSVSTPPSSCALIFSWSILFESVNDRV